MPIDSVIPAANSPAFTDILDDRIRRMLCILQLHRALGTLGRIRSVRQSSHNDERPEKDQPRSDDFEQVFGPAANTRIHDLECFLRELMPDRDLSLVPGASDVRTALNARPVYRFQLLDLFLTYDFCWELADAVLNERASKRRSRLAEFNAVFQQMEDDYALDALKRICGDESLTDRLSILFYLNLKLAQRVASLLYMPVPFEMVLNREMDCIHAARHLRDLEGPSEDLKDPISAARDANLVGLALSGGGIRSATFNLGILQALSEVEVKEPDSGARGDKRTPRLLEIVDYLSTVSGGGYIGAWLHAWILRRDEAAVEECLRDGTSARGIRKVIQDMSPAQSPDPEAAPQAPIKFLRRYSKFLAPRFGVFTADTWTMIVTALRNTLLNLVILALGLAAALMVPRMLYDGFVWAWQAGSFWGVIAIVAGLLAFAAVFCGVNLRSFDDPNRNPNDFIYSQAGVQTLVVAPLAAAALFFAAWLFGRARPASYPINIDNYWLYVYTGIAASALLLSFSVVGRYSDCWYNDFDKGAKTSGWWKAFGWLGVVACSLLSGAAAAGLLYAFRNTFHYWVEHTEAWTVLTFGTPLMVGYFALVLACNIGLLGRNLPDDRREWWSRTAAYMLLYAVGWLGLFWAAIWGPWFVAWLQTTSYRWLATSGLSATWLLSTAMGVFAGRSRNTGSNTHGSTNGYLQIIATVTPYVFIAGLLILLSFGIHILSLQFSGPIGLWGTTRYKQDVPNTNLDLSYKRGTQSIEMKLLNRNPLDSLDMTRDFYAAEHRRTAARHSELPGAELLEMFHPEYMRALPSYFYLIAGLVGFGVAFLLAWRVNVNEFSMHHFYRNRLIRCYLGASQKRRRPNRFTGLDPDDDRCLGDFTAKADSPLPPISSRGAARQRYSGPYPIINATLNLVQGDELAWQDRKGQSFVFTPEFCGYAATPTKEVNTVATDGAKIMRYGYRPTRLYAYPGNGIHLGSAAAISGAALSPNEGYNTSSANAFLLTIFNARLGWWISNTRHARAWRRPSPAWGLFYLMRELFANTNNKSKYLYLSDGGHFENLGIYELVRRRCRYIIASDASQDGDLAFEDIGNAIRKCRTDFGAEIQIGLDALKRDKKSGYSTSHCVVGRILYADGRQGTIVYIKPTLSGDEPADVAEYRRRRPEFPHETTADQFFTESQFESYRRLGYHIARKVFGERNLINVGI